MGKNEICLSIRRANINLEQTSKRILLKKQLASKGKGDK